MVIWLIGLAGAGKTTIGRALYDLLKARNPATVFLDGDGLRQVMGDDLGHDIEGRRKNGKRLSMMSKFLSDQDIDVICCVLSLFHDQQRWNRDNIPGYREVYVEVPMEELIRRDQKGLYSGALAGRINNVVGVDIPFEPPPGADLVLPNAEPETDFAAVAERIAEALRL